MGVLAHSEKRITSLIEAAPHPGGDFYADILEVLHGRREQVEMLRQELEGAVEERDHYVAVLYEIARLNPRTGGGLLAKRALNDRPGYRDLGGQSG